MFTPDDVNQGIATLSPTMATINGQAGHLAAGNQTAWAGVYQGYQDFVSRWNSEGTFFGGGGFGGLLGLTQAAVASDAMSKLANYQTLATQYAAQIQASGGQAPIVPNVNPGPVTPPSGGSSSSSSSGGISTATAVVTVAVIGGLAYGIHAVLSMEALGSLWKRVRR